MRGFFFRLIITALGLWVADELLAGLAFDSARALIVSALVLGLVNAVIRPIILILTLPLTVLTLAGSAALGVYARSAFGAEGVEPLDYGWLLRFDN